MLIVLNTENLCLECDSALYGHRTAYGRDVTVCWVYVAVGQD